MAGIGAKIKDALTPGSRTTNEHGMGGVDTDTNRNLLSSPNTYPTGNDGVAGTHTGHHTGVHTGNVTHATGNTVCETRTFTEVEDRPIMRERVERIIEHRPVEKQFVVETRPAGEREIAEGRHFESAGVREYEVDRVEGTKCPTTTGAGAAGTHNRVL